MPVPHEIPSVKLGLPGAIIKKLSVSEAPSIFPQKDPRFVCSVANVNTSTGKVQLGNS